MTAGFMVVLNITPSRGAVTMPRFLPSSEVTLAIACPSFTGSPGKASNQSRPPASARSHFVSSAIAWYAGFSGSPEIMPNSIKTFLTPRTPSLTTGGSIFEISPASRMIDGWPAWLAVSRRLFLIPG